MGERAPACIKPFISLELDEKLSYLTQELPFGVSTPQIEKYVPKEFQTEALLSFYLAGNMPPHELRMLALKNLREPLLFAYPFLAHGSTARPLGLYRCGAAGGIVVNNAIIMVDHINQLRRSGLKRREAIIAGAADRLRPILMTSLTTIVGLLPIVVGADKTGLWYALALATMGGMMRSTLLVLLVVPALCALKRS